VIDLLLGLSRHRPRVRLETVRRDALTDERIKELHALSNRLATEDYEHFAIHARTNERVHVFRRADTDEIVGFQFWQTKPLGVPRSRVAPAGKLRVVPEFRNRGLHLLSMLLFFAQNKIRHPRTRYYCTELASVFGFISVTEALADYTVFDPDADDPLSRAIRASFEAEAAESEFELRPGGLFFVDIFLTADTFAPYPASFWQRPAARVYAEVNPDFRSNGCYAAFWFGFTPRNVLALSRRIARKLFGPSRGR
jgi:hypothetical protein